MITERSRDFVKTVTDSNDPKKSRINHVIDVDEVKKVISEEIGEFDALKESLDNETKPFFEKIMKRCKDAEIVFDAKSRQMKEKLEGKKNICKYERR